MSAGRNRKKQRRIAAAKKRNRIVHRRVQRDEQRHRDLAAWRAYWKGEGPMPSTE